MQNQEVAKCPKCGSTEIMGGYGFAAGPFGAYEMCECGYVISVDPDSEVYSEEEIKKIQEMKNGLG